MATPLYLRCYDNLKHCNPKRAEREPIQCNETWHRNAPQGYKLARNIIGAYPIQKPKADN